jgi:ribosomal protein S18 acetylase RimI-like enzyme
MTQPSSLQTVLLSSSGERGIVRKADKRDVPSIVAIHRKAFRNSFLTQLGSGFLNRYYGLVLDYHRGILLVSRGRDGLEGFACGFVDPEGFYGMMRRNRRIFALPILFGVVRRPSLVTRILDNVQRVEKPALEKAAGSCELSSIAVTPEAGHQGIGKNLVKAFLRQAWETGARRAYLDTDADDNTAANAFYRKVGFQVAMSFEKSEGRWMNEYVIHRSGNGGTAARHDL